MNMTEEQKQNLLKMIESPNIDDINLAGNLIKNDLGLTDEQLEFLGNCSSIVLNNNATDESNYVRPDTMWRVLMSKIEPVKNGTYSWQLKGHDPIRTGQGLMQQLFSSTDRYGDKPLIGMTQAKGKI